MLRISTPLIRTIFILLTIIVSCREAYAQSASLEGRVVNETNDSAIPFAAIYFANSTIGELSDEGGAFVIKNIPIGKYEVLVSCVGYQTLRTAIEFQSQDQQYTFKLR